MAFARRDGGWKWSLPHITLASEVFIAMLRIPIMLDPTGSRRLLPWTAVEFFFTLDFSFAIATNFLIAFYWYVIFKTIMKEPGNIGLQKYKVSCGVAVAFLVILEVASSGARAAFVEARILFIFKALLYLALSFVVGVFFAKTAYKALRFRWKAKGVVGRSKERHRQDIKVRASPVEKKPFHFISFQATLLIVTCTFCIFAFCLTVIFVPTPLYNTPGGYFALRFLASFFVYSISCSQVFLFNAGTGEQTSSKMDNTQTRDNTNAISLKHGGQSGSASFDEEDDSSEEEDDSSK